MTVDFLDPFRPVTPPEVPVDRHDEPERNRESDPVEDERRQEPPPRTVDETDAYDDRGESVDEYA